MAGKNIQFEVGQASTASTNINRAGVEIGSLMKSIGSDVRKVDTWWEGQGSKAYVKQFTDVKKNVDSLIECITKISKQIDETVRVKVEEEDKLEKLLNGK